LVFLFSPIAGPLMQSFGFCTSAIPNLLPSSLTSVCLQGKLTIQQLVANRLLTSKSPYAFIQSKVDDVQQSFYWMVGITSHVNPVLTPNQFYGNVSSIFSNYNKDASFLTYLVDGWQHCFTDTNVMYTTDAMGKDDAPSLPPSLPQWLSSFPVQAGGDADSVCAGELEGEYGTKIGAAAGDVSEQDKNTYCSNLIVPKSYPK